jgi:hypothetical protein
MARKSVDEAIAQSKAGGQSSRGFTEDRLRSAGYSPAEVKRLMAHYESLEDGTQVGRGRKAAFTYSIFGAGDRADKATATRKAKAGNGKGSAKRKAAARKAARTRKANGQGS